MSNFLKTSSDSGILWKPWQDISKSDLPKSIVNAQKDTKDHYNDKIEKYKQERHEQLVEKIKEFDNKQSTQNDNEE